MTPPQDLTTVLGHLENIGAAQCRHGTMLYPLKDVYVGKSLEVYGEWCPLEVEVLELFLRSGDFVIEVGANVGSHTIPLARKVGRGGRIYALEPQPRIHQILSANALLNNCPQIVPLQLAASDHNDYSRMPIIDYGQALNFGAVSLSFMNSVAPTDDHFQISQVRIDDLFELPRLRLIKLDVEGMEGPVLQGARGLIRRFQPFIYAEADLPEATAPIVEAVAGLGYRGYWHSSPLHVTGNFRETETNHFPGVSCVNMLLTPSHIQIEGLRDVEGKESHPRYGS